MNKLLCLFLVCCSACTPIIKQQESYSAIQNQTIIFRNQLDITSTYYRSNNLPPNLMIRYDQLASFPNQKKQTQINTLIQQLVESFAFSGIPKYSGVLPFIAQHPIEQYIVNATIGNTFNDIMELSLHKEIQLNDGFRIQDYQNHYIHLATGSELTIHEIMNSERGVEELNTHLHSSIEYIDPAEVEETLHLYNAPFHKPFEGLQPGFSLILTPNFLHVILNDSCEACYFPVHQMRISPYIITLKEYTPTVYDQHFKEDRLNYATEGSYEFKQFSNLDFSEENIDEPLNDESNLTVHGYFPQYLDSYWMNQKQKMKQDLWQDIQDLQLSESQKADDITIFMSLHKSKIFTTLTADLFIYGERGPIVRNKIYQYRTDTNAPLALQDLFQEDFDYNSFIRDQWQQEKMKHSVNWDIDRIMEGELYFMIYPANIVVYSDYLNQHSQQKDLRIEFTIDDFGIQNLADFLRFTGG